MKRWPLTLALVLTAGFLSGSDVNPASTGCSNHPGMPILAVPVRVMSTKLQVVEDLQAKDFVVTENGIPRQTCGFAHVRQPVSVGILLDTSGSMGAFPDNSLLAMACAGINQFLDSSGPQDEYFLEYVNNGPDMKCVFRCDLRHIRAGLQVNPKGRTALIDGIYMALNGMRHAHHINRCLLVVSDGGENASVYNDKELNRAFAAFPIPVFAVIPVSVESRYHFQPDNYFDLGHFANESGGYAVKILDEKGMFAAMKQVATAMRSPYILSLTDAPPSGAARGSRIRVAVKGVPGHPFVFCKPLFTTTR